MNPPHKNERDSLVAAALEAERKLERLRAARRGAHEVSVEPALPREPLQAPPEDETTPSEIIDESGQAQWLLCPRSTTDIAPPGPSPGAVLVPGMADALARAVPAIADAIRGRQVFELIGPAAVVDQLRAGTLELVRAKDGGLLGAIRAPGGGRVLHQARFRRLPPSAMGPQLALSLLSMAVNAVHLQRIQEELAAISGKLDAVLDGQQAERYGKLRGAAEIVAEIRQQHAQTGQFAESMRLRLIAADANLRTVLYELERVHEVYEQDAHPGGAPGLSSLETHYRRTRPRVLTDARLLILAHATMIAVEKLYLLYATEHEPALVAFHQNKQKQGQERQARLAHHLTRLEAFNQRVQVELRAVQDSKWRHALHIQRTERLSELLAADRRAVLDVRDAQRRLSVDPDDSSFFPGATILRIDARREEASVTALSIDAPATPTENSRERQE